MRTLIQRVSKAMAIEKSSQKTLASISQGLVIFCAFEPKDDLISIEQMVQKIKNLRVFSDASDKLNLPGSEVSASYLLVSQFTLYANCKYGNRPSFESAAPKPKAKECFEHFVNTFTKSAEPNSVKSTPFGSNLALELTNDGPVTIWLDSFEVL